MSTEQNNLPALSRPAGLPQGMDPRDIHLVDLDDEGSWSLRCPGQAPGADTAPRLCTVALECERCAQALESVPEEDYEAHGVQHCVSASEPRRSFVVEQGVCGLASHLYEGRTSWPTELFTERGPGLYAVGVAQDESDTLIGTDPVRVSAP